MFCLFVLLKAHWFYYLNDNLLDADEYIQPKHKFQPALSAANLPRIQSNSSSNSHRW